MNWDDEYALLKQEVSELLSELESLVVKKENSSFSESDVAHLFRLVHTLKGNCGSFGFTHCPRLIHEMEHVFENIRSDVAQLDSTLITLILEMCDLITDTFSVTYGDDLTEINSEEIEKQIIKVQKYKESSQNEADSIVSKSRVSTSKGQKVSTYEMILNYRGIIENVQVQQPKSKEEVLTIATVGGYKKSFLEQLQSRQQVYFDFSEVQKIDINGVNFLKAIPQIVQVKGATLAIGGISAPIIKEANKNNFDISKVYEPFLIAEDENQGVYSSALQATENRFDCSVILSNTNSKEQSLGTIVTLFSKLRTLGELNVTFDMDSVASLEDLNDDSVLQWQFSLHTKTPQAEVEAYLRDLPSDVFWEWIDKPGTGSAASHEVLLSEWQKLFILLLNTSSQKSKEIAKAQNRLKKVMTKLKKSTPDPTGLTVDTLLALFKMISSSEK